MLTVPRPIGNRYGRLLSDILFTRKKLKDNLTYPYLVHGQDRYLVHCRSVSCSLQEPYLVHGQDPYLIHAQQINRQLYDIIMEHDDGLCRVQKGQAVAIAEFIPL